MRHCGLQYRYRGNLNSSRRQGPRFSSWGAEASPQRGLDRPHQQRLDEPRPLPDRHRDARGQPPIGRGGIPDIEGRRRRDVAWHGYVMIGRASGQASAPRQAPGRGHTQGSRVRGKAAGKANGSVRVPAVAGGCGPISSRSRRCGWISEHAIAIARKPGDGSSQGLAGTGACVSSARAPGR